MFPICQKKKGNHISGLTNMEEVGHTHSAHTKASTSADAWAHSQHTHTHRAGNTSCRLHGLEMRNMIHFLSMWDTGASTLGAEFRHKAESKKRCQHRILKPGCAETLNRDMMCTSRGRDLHLFIASRALHGSAVLMHGCSSHSVDATGSRSSVAGPPLATHHILCLQDVHPLTNSSR